MATTPIGDNLRRLRGDLSRAELARRSGLHRQHLIKIENGERKNVRSDTLQRLAAALGVEVAALLAPAVAPRRRRTG